ncbi:AAA family ATPase [Streptococcus suis]|uniref:AAA family ATPase n=2 Tax=Streptococcus suis TaxID=1307 RepID=UPI00137B334D|nr:AAA family ATPase [Streptococcus suis]MBO3756889.1 AAA family ATPase [Streptococcus suis]
MMKKKGMRLVAMIEEIKSKEKSKEENKEEKYEIINFLPDIKVEHTDGKNFKIEEKDYIKIPYAEGIDDLTVIVGENGVGKTRLVNDILSMPADKVFVFYDVDNDRYRYYTQIETDIKNHWTSQIKFLTKKSGSKHYTQKSPRVSEANIVKFSNAIELSSPERELTISKDVSTSRLLKESELHYVNLSDMKKQIVFLNSAIVNKFDILRFIKSKKIVINKDDSLKYYKTTLEIDDILAPRKLSGTNDDDKKNDNSVSQHTVDNKYSPKKQLLQNLYDVLIYTFIKERELREAEPLEKPTENDRYKFKLVTKDGQWQEIPSCYNLKKKLGVKDWNDFLIRWDKEERIQTAWAEANAYLDYFKHPEDSFLDREKRKIRLGRNIDKEVVINDFLSLESIGKEYREKLVSLVKKIEEIEDPAERKTVSEPEIFDVFYEKYYSILMLVEEMKGVKFEKTATNSYISPFYNLCIDKLLSTITFSWDGLSSGELALLNLFGRLYSIKKGLKATNILLLLDEVDLGLHPEWQRRWISVALPIIKEIFKGKYIQIVMTTHSPIMLSDIYAENVIMLRKGDNGQRIIVENQGMEKNQVTTFGQNIHDLYRESFFLESTRGEYAKEQIQETIEVLYELELWQDKASRIFDIYKGKCKERYEELFAGDTDDLIKKIDDEAFEVWFSHRSQIEKDIENIKKISNEEEYANYFYEKYYKKKARYQGEFTKLFREKFKVDKQIIDKLKSGEIIFPEFNQINFKDEYKTQYRAKYIKLREGILNNSFIREKIQKSSSDDQFKQILKYRIDAIGEQLIKRKLLSIWDKIWFSENLSDSPSEKSELNGLFQQLKEASANNEQILTIVSEIEELMNSHNGEE